MTAAFVSPTEIASVLESVPDYSRYDHDGQAQDLESPFRLSLGRIAKDWGDQLLDVIEHKPNPLNHKQAILVDSLLQGVGEIFRALNASGSIDVDALDTRTQQAMRRCDGELLDVLEIAHRRMLELQHRDFAGVWIDGHAKPLHRDLAQIYKRLAQRNQMLGIHEPTTLDGLELEPAPGEYA